MVDLPSSVGGRAIGDDGWGSVTWCWSDMFTSHVMCLHRWSSGGVLTISGGSIWFALQSCTATSDHPLTSDIRSCTLQPLHLANSYINKTCSILSFLILLLFNVSENTNNRVYIMPISEVTGWSEVAVHDCNACHNHLLVRKQWFDTHPAPSTLPKTTRKFGRM